MSFPKLIVSAVLLAASFSFAQEKTDQKPRGKAAANTGGTGTTTTGDRSANDVGGGTGPNDTTAGTRKTHYTGGKPENPAAERSTGNRATPDSRRGTDTAGSGSNGVTRDGKPERLTTPQGERTPAPMPNSIDRDSNTAGMGHDGNHQRAAGTAPGDGTATAKDAGR